MARTKKPNLPTGRALNTNEFHTVTPEILALASSFRVSYFLGRGAWDHHDTETLAEAAKIVIKMEAEYSPQYSRPAIVYARFANGWAILVPRAHLFPR